MSVNYSAHQFESAFTPTKLGNWEVPRKTYFSRPTIRNGTTRVICDENGRFLSNVLRSKSSPWSGYKNTWQLPDKISRHQANELNTTIARRRKQQTADKQDQQQPSPNPNQDFSSSEQPYLSRSKLLQEEQNREQEKIDSDPITTFREKDDEVEDNFEKMKLHTQIPDKPTERSASPLIPAYYNFQMAKKMAAENLEHQPLPDCIMDQAFRKLQAQGVLNPGLALDMLPSASGVGVKTYKAGPTHCTKMKIFRPKTCGVVPKPVVASHLFRPQTSYPGKDKMGSMDLAICWDFRPLNPFDEPKPAKHIDGTNDSAGPAVFTLVKTPRTPDKIETARSGGIFTNTLGDEGFFDKDILRRKTGFAAQRNAKCSCGTSPINIPNTKSNPFRSQSATREASLTEKRKRCKSSPNLSQIANASQSSSYKENVSRYNEQIPRTKEHTCSKYGPKIKDPVLAKRTSRLCQKIDPQPYPEIVQKDTYKAAFKAGIPKSNSSGTVTSFDSGCSTMSASTCSTKAVHVPKPRHPYAKKNYNIDTLVPPFACIKGGAGQGGYPEHWRLASVYQHAYKPIEQRRRPLLDTVYK